LYFNSSHLLLSIAAPELLLSKNSAQIFNSLSDAPGEIEDVSQLLEAAVDVAANLTNITIETQRRRYLAFLMADQGALVNPDADSNLPKQHLTRYVEKKHLCNPFLSIFNIRNELECRDKIAWKLLLTTSRL